ncbi:MAG: hypothetical protein AB8G99_02725, partial [Planctomycetaceae bacterium]
TYNYTGWFRPRAAGRTQAERCYAPDTFRPRGFGRLFARPANGMRVDYRPYALNNWNSQHGPAYYPIAEDPRCPHCDKQGCCLSGLFGSCGSCGGCNTCGNGDCDGGCDTGACDDGACDDGGCGLGGGRRAGWSEWITRAPRRTNLRQRLRPRARRRMARNGGCLDGSCGQNSCNACAQGMSLANNTACNSCGQNGCSSCGTQAPANSCGCQTQTQTQSQTQNASNGTGFIRHNATTEAQQMFNDRTAYEEAAAGVIN